MEFLILSDSTQLRRQEARPRRVSEQLAGSLQAGLPPGPGTDPTLLLSFFYDTSNLRAPLASI